MDGAERGREVVTEGKGGQNVQREASTGGTLMEEGRGWLKGVKQSEKKLQTYSRKIYMHLRKDTIREMACLQINWN